jgi:hypothetical protein
MHDLGSRIILGLITTVIGPRLVEVHAGGSAAHPAISGSKETPRSTSRRHLHHSQHCPEPALSLFRSGNTL